MSQGNAETSEESQQKISAVRVEKSGYSENQEAAGTQLLLGDAGIPCCNLKNGAQIREAAALTPVRKPQEDV